MSRLVLVLFLGGLAPSLVSGQSLREKDRAKEKDPPVPKAYLPPAGMCRIWVDNVPAARQPAPTDCATAIRNKPPNARVIFPAARDGRTPAARGATSRPDTTTKRKPPG